MKVVAPEPDAPLVKVIHDGGLVAVHGHPGLTEMLTAPLPPVAVKPSPPAFSE